MTTVFIGSTSRDLADYRKAAIDTCLRLDLHPIAMEYFEAMPAGATEGSKRQLEKADLYVGVFAHRYGYIESGYEKSVTEIEFNYAGERRLDRLCFLVDPKYPWPPDAIEYENLPRLKEFKERIDTTLIRAQFTTVDNFTAMLMQALAQWCKIQSPPPLPSMSIAPPQPTLVIGREDDLTNLKTRLTATADSSRITVIRGWPGVGKTTLVTALAYDPNVTKAFPDGVLWAQVGENSNPFSELAVWGRALGVSDVGKTLDEVVARIRAILQHKRALLIVDDIWKPEDWPPFQVAGPQCATLVTTRFIDIARTIAPPDDIYVLAVLRENAALELLRRLAPTVVKDYPQQSFSLVRDLEGLPLAIRVAGRVLEGEAALGVGGVTELMHELRASGKLLENVAPNDRFDPKTGTTPTINLLLKRSTDRLDPETRDHFAYLGAFAPKPATFNVEAMRAVWLVDDPLPSVRKLVDCGLLEPIPAQGRFWMHQMLVMHAESLLDEE